MNTLANPEPYRGALTAALPFFLIFVANAFAQDRAEVTEVKRVIVTGSNIPTAEETGPNPVDTYRPADLEKLGIRNATDLTTFLPQEAGGTTNLNISNGGLGTVQFNLRGLLPKETLVLVDGKRVPYALGGAGSSAGVNINLIPFVFVDHIDILKDGASAVYGSDAVAGVVNFFLIHKFRGLEIGGTYGNTNLGASNDMGEWEAWLKAGTGDDKTDIVVIADFWERTGGLFSTDRDISANAFFIPFGGFDQRSGFFPGRVGNLRLLPRMFFGPDGPPQPGVNTPIPHSAPNAATSPFYKNPFVIAPNAYPGAPGIIGPNARKFRPQVGTDYKGGGDYFAYNFAAVTPALPSAERQSFYGSLMRDICDKHLVVFADFKIVRSLFDSSFAAVPFTPDPFKNSDGTPFSSIGISVPISNPFNPFTVGDTTLINNGVPVPVTTGVRFRAINDSGPRSAKLPYYDYLFDVGLRGELGEFGDYFRTWNWELGFRYSRNESCFCLGAGQVSQSALRDALLDTDPATAFDPFLNFTAHNTRAARARVYIELHNTGVFEWPLGYATVNGNLFNLPAGPVSFAIGGEYHGERVRIDRDSISNTFDAIGPNGQSFKVNRDVWGMYEEVRVPFTSPIWNFPGFYSFEVDFAEREEWYTNNTSAVLPTGFQPFVPSGHSRYDAQKPKVSVRWQPLDPKWIGAITLRGSYTEAFHAPTLLELTPASTQNFAQVHDPFSIFTDPQIEQRFIGNPNLHPEVAYEWTYGIVYSPKWIRGLTLSSDWWHIDMRDIVRLLGAQFIISNDIPGLVFRSPPPPDGPPGDRGPITLVINPNENLAGAIFEGLDYEAIYVLDSLIFGHGDFGRLTATVNGTYLSRAQLQVRPDSKRFGIAGEFLSTSFTLTSSLPRHRANFSLFYDGPAGTWMDGLDVGAVVHFISDYNDDNIDLTVSPKPNMPITGGPNKPSLFPFRARNVDSWVTLDVIASYTFNLLQPTPAGVPGFAKDGEKNVKMKDGKEKNVVPVSTAEYGCSNWRWWLNNVTVSAGLQNVIDEDPPFVAGSFENGYDESLTTIKGRFWYVQLKKRF
jgi:iron complex outermembrane receptor protein